MKKKLISLLVVLVLLVGCNSESSELGASDEEKQENDTIADIQAIMHGASSVRLAIVRESSGGYVVSAHLPHGTSRSDFLVSAYDISVAIQDYFERSELPFSNLSVSATDADGELSYIWNSSSFSTGSIIDYTVDPPAAEPAMLESLVNSNAIENYESSSPPAYPSELDESSSSPATQDSAVEPDSSSSVESQLSSNDEIDDELQEYVSSPESIQEPIEEEESGNHGTVYWVRNGQVYHTTEDCPSLSRSTNIQSGSVEQSGKSRVCNVCG